MNPTSITQAARVVGLVGRPNSGKTSLMMHLTGAGQRPVNFPGSSVERVEGTVRVGELALRVVDLPGIGSLDTASPDEELTVSWLRGEGDDAPDVLCAVVDTSKLSVELRLIARLTELGVPLVVALNKADVARKAGCAINAEELADRLGVPVIETDGRRGSGVQALCAALAVAESPPAALSSDPDAIAASVETKTAPRPSWSERIDRVVLHRWLGLPLLGLVMFAMFQLVYQVADPFVGWVEAGQDALSALVAGAIAEGALRAFVIDGLINGLGSVLVFVPQIALLIAFVAVLEASGYMARAAFLLDRVMCRFGLSGRSFVPLTTSFACAIPGILASRIIDNERDRIATIVVAPLMSCSARLPVYVVLIGAFFPVAWAGLVLFGLYALGIVTAALVSWCVRRTVLRGGQSLLMMELPVYQPPSARVVGRQVWTAVREFLIVAGTVIFACAVLIWLLSYYPRPAAIHARYEQQRGAAAVIENEAARELALARIDNAELAAYREQSYLARGGKAVQPLFAPAGFDWRTTVGILAAFPARELIVPTYGILYSIGEADAGDFDLASLGDDDPSGLRQRLREATDSDGNKTMNPLIALALMVFFALCSQCAATLGAIKRETRSWRWPIFTFTYMTALAWLAATAVYQVGSLLGYGL